MRGVDKTSPLEERIAFYNETIRSLRELLSDAITDPACFPQLLAADDVAPNDYNPNSVASKEMDLLEESIRADGITMPVVVYNNGDKHVVVDGFHRRTVSVERLGRRWLPCSIIDKSLSERMASTVRHNRARGKHGVELMGALVREMARMGATDAQICRALGMSEEELLRLRQTVGAAAFLAAPQYGRSWGGRDGPNYPDA